MSIRSLLRWAMVLLLLAFTWHEVRGMRPDYKDWREAKRIGDHSAADFYLTNLEWSGGLILVAWGIGAGVLFALRAKRRA